MSEGIAFIYAKKMGGADEEGMRNEQSEACKAKRDMGVC